MAERTRDKRGIFMSNSNQSPTSLGLLEALLGDNKKVCFAASMTHRAQFDSGLILDHK